MVELYPSFRESGTPTNPTDAASEVLWSCVRMMGRAEKSASCGRCTAGCESQIDYADIYARLERATNALAEYAMRAVEEYDA
jgi:ferredoxin